MSTKKITPGESRLCGDADYAGPTGREHPGEHWNARLIREQAEQGVAGVGKVGSRNREPADLVAIMMCAWCLREQHFGPGPTAVQHCQTQGCECWCRPSND